MKIPAPFYLEPHFVGVVRSALCHRRARTRIPYDEHTVLRIGRAAHSVWLDSFDVKELVDRICAEVEDYEYGMGMYALETTGRLP